MARFFNSGILVNVYADLPRKCMRLLTRPYNVIFVLLVSSFFGFYLGMCIFPTWQYCVEYAQVQSGIVKYPIQTPQQVFMSCSWSLINQLSAIALKCGISEMDISLFVSGIMGLLSFQAISLTTLALSSNCLLSISLPLLILFSGAYNFGEVYPIFLLHFEGTHGVIGLSYILLVIGFLGLGWLRTGSFLLGIAPAIHLSMGSMLWLVVFICLLWNKSNYKGFFKKLITYFMLGCVISFVSILFHIITMESIPDVDLDIVKKHFYFFIHYWDAHRMSVDFLSPDIWINIAGLGILIYWLICFRANIQQNSPFILYAFLTSAVFSLVFSASTLITPEWLPMFFVQMIPARFLNLLVLGYPVLIAGLLGQQRNNVWSQFFLSLFIIALCISVFPVPFLKKIFISQRQFVLIVLFVFSILLVMKHWLPSINFKSEFLGKLPLVVEKVILIVFIVLVCKTYYLDWQYMKIKIRKERDDRLLAKVASRKGLILTSSNIDMVQLLTRRPVLLDGGTLDNLCYIPKTAPNINRILNEIYGIDFFNPPQETIGMGSLPHFAGKTLWESRSLEQWQKIRKKYGVIDILTYNTWRLKLPKVLHNSKYSLYYIP